MVNHQYTATPININLSGNTLVVNGSEYKKDESQTHTHYLIKDTTCLHFSPKTRTYNYTCKFCIEQSFLIGNPLVCGAHSWILRIVLSAKVREYEEFPRLTLKTEVHEFNRGGYPTSLPFIVDMDIGRLPKFFIWELL